MIEFILFKWNKFLNKLNIPVNPGWQLQNKSTDLVYSLLFENPIYIPHRFGEKCLYQILAQKLECELLQIKKDPKTIYSLVIKEKIPYNLITESLISNLANTLNQGKIDKKKLTQTLAKIDKENKANNQIKDKQILTVEKIKVIKIINSIIFIRVKINRDYHNLQKVQDSNFILKKNWIVFQ